MKWVIFVLVFVLLSGLASAAHFITGQVNDSLDGTIANGKTIVVWNVAGGENDNITDVIGPLGNSGVDNIYLVDCELLNSSCSVDDEIRARVIDDGSAYFTGIVNLTVTGAGFDAMPPLTLNSPPNITLDSPINGANLSSSEVNFSCTAHDIDSNLANITLYGNWNGGWHANQTMSASSNVSNVNFTESLEEGNYIWSCLASDNLSSMFFGMNYTFTVDLTPPNITDVTLNLTGAYCGITDYVRVNCTLSDSILETVIIEAFEPDGDGINYSASLLEGDTYFANVLLNETGVWRFGCFANDSAGNFANFTSLESVDIHSADPDLLVDSNFVYLDDLNPIENQSVIVNATIQNVGCGNITNALVGFYEIDSSGETLQINGNQSTSVNGLENVTVNVSWSAKIGNTTISVLADINDSFAEFNESNNEANFTLNVTSWQVFYGNVSIDKLLGDNIINNLSLWFNESSLTGNLFISDTESDIDWTSLLAIGKNISNGSASDFSDIDLLLNMSNFTDSVSNIFTTDGTTPRDTEGFFVHQRTIEEVPVINSTDTSPFLTGILWDSSDDSDGEFSIADKEDLVFVGRFDSQKTGEYGVYDYEMRIPVRLREYDLTDNTDVFIYFDLN